MTPKGATFFYFEPCRGSKFEVSAAASVVAKRCPPDTSYVSRFHIKRVIHEKGHSFSFEILAAASVDYIVRSISTPFSSIAFKSSSNASSSVIRTSKALIGQILIIESVPILLVG